MALADLLLALAVLGLVLAAVLPLLARQSDEVLAKGIADDLTAFRSAAEEHFKANRTAYESAMRDGTGAAQLCKVDVNPVDGSGGVIANSTTLHTCAIDGTMLAYLKVLPPGMRARNAYGESWVAIHRTVDSAGAPTAGVESLFVSAAVSGLPGPVPADAQRYQLARAAAGYLQRGGGAVPDTDRGQCIALRTTGAYQGCGDGWKANLGQFMSPTQLNQFAMRLPN